MRVRGNVAPDALSICDYPPVPGHAEVRLRENISELSEFDEQTGREVKIFEYDEYTFHLPGRENLMEEIEANMADWLATGRTLEINEGASAFVAEKETNAEYEAALSEIEAALGVTT